MNLRTEQQIKEFLRTHSYALDVPEAFYGDEPGTFGKRACV